MIVQLRRWLPDRKLLIVAVGITLRSASAMRSDSVFCKASIRSLFQQGSKSHPPERVRPHRWRLMRGWTRAPEGCLNLLRPDSEVTGVARCPRILRGFEDLASQQSRVPDSRWSHALGHL